MLDSSLAITSVDLEITGKAKEHGVLKAPTRRKIRFVLNELEITKKEVGRKGIVMHGPYKAVTRSEIAFFITQGENILKYITVLRAILLITS